MSNLVPVVPDYTTASFPQVVSWCQEIYQRREEIIGRLGVDEARELLRRVHAVESYVQEKAQKEEALRAARILEAAVGAALGPAPEPSKSQRVDIDPSLAREGYSEIHKDDRYRFRRMFEHRHAWEPELEKRGLTRAEVFRIIEGKHVRGTLGTGENEWYTPLRYVEAARSVLGEIDLDPASSEIAQKEIEASAFFTKEDDGLAREWWGKVWMNPPYAQPFIEQFIRKLVTEHTEGRVAEAIALTHNYTDTAWFHHAAEACSAICFTRGRIRFVSPDGEEAAPTQGQAFFYFGHNVDGFRDVFSEFGVVVQP